MYDRLNCEAGDAAGRSDDRFSACIIASFARRPAFRYVTGLVGGPFRRALPGRVRRARMVMLVTVSPRKPIYHELNDKNFFSVNLN